MPNVRRSEMLSGRAPYAHMFFGCHSDIVNRENPGCCYTRTIEPYKISGECVVMKRFMLLVLFLLFSSASEGAEIKTASYFAPDYRFEDMTSLCVVQVDMNDVPETMRSSILYSLNDSLDAALKDHNVRMNAVLKSQERAWRDIVFIYSPQQFSQPDESPEATAFFMDKLKDASKGALRAKISVRTEQYWQKPSTGTYTVTQETKKRVKIKQDDGRYKEVEVIVQEEVEKEYYIPGKWITNVYAQSDLHLFDTKRLDEHDYVASASARRAFVVEKKEVGREYLPYITETTRKAVEKMFLK